MTTTLHELEELISQAERTLGINSEKPDHRTPTPQYAPPQAAQQAAVTLVPALDENVIWKINQLQKLYAKNGFVVGLMVGSLAGIAISEFIRPYVQQKPGWKWKNQHGFVYGAFLYLGQLAGKKIGHWYGRQKAKQVLGAEHPELRTMIEHYIDKSGLIT